jgi:hypothetical protein
LQVVPSWCSRLYHFFYIYETSAKTLPKNGLRHSFLRKQKAGAAMQSLHTDVMALPFSVIGV